MQSTFHNILKYIQNFFSQKEKEMLTHPQRDWHILLASFVVITLILISWGVYFFWQIKSGEVFVTEATPSALLGQTIDKTALDDVLVYYADKEQAYNLFSSEPFERVDPSR